MLQLRALQRSDRWAAAVPRAIRPLAKPVQIVAWRGGRERDLAARVVPRNSAHMTHLKKLR